jgi:hypothetical protein
MTENYAKLETKELKQVTGFIEQNTETLKTAELSIRCSAEGYIVELRPTDEIIS